VRTLSAIILLTWAACYGRCLARQCVASSEPGPPACESICCYEEEQQNESPIPDPAPPCGICEYIDSGGLLPVAGVKLPAPVLPSAVMAVFRCFYPTLAPEDLGDPVVLVLNTGPPPHLLRLEQWRAGKSLPVRGPDADS
jgi:hypothetical protein